MSAPSLRNIMQTSQREFALQRYYIFLIYAKKIATECDFFNIHDVEYLDCYILRKKDFKSIGGYSSYTRHNRVCLPAGGAP